MTEEKWIEAGLPDRRGRGTGGLIQTRSNRAEDEMRTDVARDSFPSLAGALTTRTPWGPADSREEGESLP
jgi:hypothetical protein